MNYDQSFALLVPSHTMVPTVRAFMRPSELDLGVEVADNHLVALLEKLRALRRRTRILERTGRRRPHRLNRFIYGCQRIVCIDVHVQIELRGGTVLQVFWFSQFVTVSEGSFTISEGLTTSAFDEKQTWRESEALN